MQYFLNRILEQSNWVLYTQNALYINDLEEYLLANGNNFIDFKDEICNSYVKLLVLLYADDTIVLPDTAAGLQKALEDLCNYCTKWKLQVNSSKN